MAINLPLRATPPSPEAARRPTWASSRRRWLGAVTLRLRAWRLRRSEPGGHPVADLVAAGNWAALDELLAEMEDTAVPAEWERERRHGT